MLASAPFARAYTLVVLGAVFSSYLVERIAGRVTYATIIAGLCVIGIGMLAARRREISLLRLAPTTLLAFLAWALASAFWSSDTAASLGGWVATASLALLAITIGHVRDTLQTVRALGDVLRWLLSISLGIEILAGILLDMPLNFIGVQGDLAALGPIQGIFGTRNMLGFVAVVGVITFLVEYRTQSVPAGLSLYSVVLAGGLATLSASPTVLVLAIAVGASAGALALVRRVAASRRATLQWALGGIVVAGLAIGYVLRHPIIAFLGAGSDFSARMELWSAMADVVRFRPVHGWGWYGPWRMDEFPFNLINFRLDTSHATGLNAFVDVLLQLGWVGLLVFAILLGTALVRSWLDASERRSVVHAWTPLVLVALVVDSLFESFTLAGTGWLLLVVCAVHAGQSRSWRGRVDVAALGGR